MPSWSKRLRDAGAVILGKTNLSEWANFRSTHSSSGWSGRGGQTRNPYVLDRNPCGSSAGTGTAVAANLASVGVGTETDGSVICPAAMTGLVGIKPTAGTGQPRRHHSDLAHSQDTAGPMTRTVADAAALLTAMAGSDPADAATAQAGSHATDYTKSLKAGALAGKRIGVVRKLAGMEPNADRVLEQCHRGAEGARRDDRRSGRRAQRRQARRRRVHGAAVRAQARPCPVPCRRGRGAQDARRPDRVQQGACGPGNALVRAGVVRSAQAKGPLTDKAYLDALANSKRMAGPEGIDAAMQAQHLDALLAPSWGPAYPTDPILGDHVVSGDPTVGGASQLTSVAGYPCITVPAGRRA